MRFAAAVTTERDAAVAARALADEIGGRLAGAPVDLAVAFLSAALTRDAAAVAASLRRRLSPRVLVGCTAEGVIGSEHEIEGGAAISLIGAHLPGVEVTPFTLEPAGWRLPAIAPKVSMMLGDPFSMPMDGLLADLNATLPGVPVIGGMASGAQEPGGNALILDERVLDRGAVGVFLSGALEVDVIVSQGCRPVGNALHVTAARENLILALDGDSPLGRLRGMLAALPAPDRALLKNGLFIGRAIDPAQEGPGRGDFLIRGVMGAIEESGAIAIGDRATEGDVVQFQLRDAATATEDLEMMLAPQSLFERPSGALLFSCNGRGTRLYDHPDGDIATIRAALGDVSLAGLFCAGEIGPIGGRNFLHGHTASLGLFRPKR